MREPWLGNSLPIGWGEGVVSPGEGIGFMPPMRVRSWRSEIAPGERASRGHQLGGGIGTGSALPGITT